MKKKTVKKVKKTETVKRVKKSERVKKSNKAICLINLGLLLLGVVLTIVGIFAKPVEMPFKVCGMLLVLFSLVVYAVRSEKYVLVKSVLATALVAVVWTWLIPNGAFSADQFASYGLSRIGISDIPTILYYAVYFALDKLLLLFIIAGFYGVLSVTKGYQRLVTSIAKKLEKSKLTFVLLLMIVFIILTSLLSNVLVVVAFVPFVISILSKMKVDKLTAFVCTFGAILVGMISSPWGTENLYWFNYYVGLTLADGLKLRLIAQLFVLIFTLLFAILRVKKLKKSKEELEAVEDTFEVESYNERTNKVGVIIVLVLVALLAILGFVSWGINFNVTVFDNFHEWLIGLGKDTPVISYLLGSASKALGSWEITTFAALLLIMSGLVGLINRIKFSDFLTAFGNGMLKMLKPIAIYTSVFIIFVVMYMTPFIPTITNWLLGLSSKFNPFLASIMAFITAMFHSDFGYTGYTVGSYLVANYADYTSVVYTVYYTMHGMAQLLLPTSGLLLLGLVYTKVEYKTWLKYIWKFAVAMLLTLLIIFTIATYV